MSFDSERAIAVLVDIENMARPGARNRGEFDIHLVMNLLAEKGRVVVKRAYADWSRYRDARRELMNAGLELIEMPSAREGAKNRADIKMAVDAMEIAYSRAHVSTFVIVSGDSDFTPLVGKLRELNKRVIGIGRDGDSSSTLLIANCDEFYFYDNIASKATRHHVEGQRPDALSLLRETLEARGREGDEHPQASAVKDSMRRRDPAFSEGDIGFSTFSKFLEDAQSKGIVRLVTDSRSGTYLVELADGSGSTLPAPAAGTGGDDESPRENAPEGRRRRRRRRGGENGESTSRTSAAPTGAEAEVELEQEADGAEVFVSIVKEREPEVEMPPLDQPLSYEDLLPEASSAAEDEASEEPPTRGARRRRKPLASTPELDTGDLEATDGDEDEAEEAPTPASARRARTRRSSSTSVDDGDAVPTASADDADGESAVASSEESAEADVDAPVPVTSGRRRVRRGTVLLAPDSEQDAPVAESTTDEQPADEKPKRRTRTKKATDDETAAAESTTDEQPADEKPKRRTRTKKATDDETPAAETTTDEQPADEKPKRRTRTKKATDGESDGLPAKVSPY